MCDISLITDAYIDYDIAALSYQRCLTTNNERYLRKTAYHLQQCVEFILKGYLEFVGVTVPQTHDVSRLIDMTYANGSACVVTDWIDTNRLAISAWEVQSQYNKSFSTCAHDMKEALEHVKDFMVANGVCKALLSEVTPTIQGKLIARIPLSNRLQENMEWNILFKLFSKKLKLVPLEPEVPFDMNIHFEAAGVTDRAAEIERLKVFYGTNDMNVIRAELKRVYGVVDPKLS